MTSIIENNRDIPLCFFIICPDLSSDNKRKLELTCSESGGGVCFLELTQEMKSRLSQVGHALGKGHNTSFLLRLLAEEILPSDVDKILYMDVDIIVNSSLKELNDYEFRADIAAGVVKDLIRIDDYHRLNIDRSQHTYFNAGVMLINLDYWRKYKVGSKSLDLIENNVATSFMPDQDALNIVMQGRVEYIHPRYNCLTFFFARDEYLENRVEGTELARVKEAICSPSVIHYVFVDKPWFKGGYLPHRDLWLQYKKISKWSTYKPHWRKGAKGAAKFFLKYAISSSALAVGIEFLPNIFIKKRCNHIYYLALALYYGFAQWLPNFDCRHFGKLSNKLRVFCVRRIFDYVGNNVNIGRRAQFGMGRQIRIGDLSNIGAKCRVPADIIIGKYVMMGSNNFFFGGFTHNTEDVSTPMRFQGFKKIAGQTRIDDDVWIGNECLFMPCVQIGSHSIIGARTVVTKNVPEYAVYAGNPGEIKKFRNLKS